MNSWQSDTANPPPGNQRVGHCGAGFDAAALQHVAVAEQETIDGFKGLFGFPASSHRGIASVEVVCGHGDRRARAILLQQSVKGVILQTITVIGGIADRENRTPVTHGTTQVPSLP